MPRWPAVAVERLERRLICMRFGASHKLVAKLQSIKVWKYGNKINCIGTFVGLLSAVNYQGKVTSIHEILTLVILSFDPLEITVILSFFIFPLIIYSRWKLL